MSNLLVPARFGERVRRLALGLEPLDAVRGMRVGHGLQILIDGTTPPLPDPRLLRHRSGLFVLTRETSGPVTIELRLCDLGEPTDPPGWRAQTNRRRLVPRRLRLAIPASIDDGAPMAERSCRPALFPGAAYPVTDAVTGLRGRVVQADVPVRWARVEARRPGAAPADPPVGRAHCDDRGEFLLLIAPAAAPLTTLERPFELDLVVYAPLPPVPMPPEEERDADGLWDLPVEDLSAAGDPDAVAAGSFPPAGWAPPAAPVRVELAYGRLLSTRPVLIP